MRSWRSWTGDATPNGGRSGPDGTGSRRHRRPSRRAAMRIADEQVLWSVPESERAGRPLLVLLHGHGMTEQIGFDLRHQLPSELVVAALRGPLSVRSGYGWFSLE